MEGLPLQDLRVVDCADRRGQLGGRILAELGADVILVEPPGGAASRRYHPMEAADSLSFAVRNWNKRGTVLDLRQEGDRHRLLDLLGGADIWLESYAPGELAGLGLDPSEVVAHLPRLVAVSMTDFGLDGPYRDWAATNDTVVAIAGELFRSGVPERPPLLVPGSLAYDVTGIMAAFAALAGCRERDAHSGRGQHLDLSALEATAQVTDWVLPNCSAVTSRLGLYSEVRAGSGLVYPLYPCQDGYVRLVILSPRQWRAMRAWLGEPEFLQDDHWDSLLGRMEIQADLLDPMFVELFADKTMADLADEAQRRGIVMTPCLGPAEVLRTPHFVERASFVEEDIGSGRRGPVASGFFEVDGRRAGWRHPAPAVPADHTAEARIEWASPRRVSGVGSSRQDRPPAAPSPTDEPGAGLPFKGVRVVDFGHGGVGVEAARLLAEYGADVIKIESRTYPDFIRLVSGSEMSASFSSSNCSKRSFGVNVKTADGLELVRRLVAGADVVVENNSTGTMDDMGLGFEDLRKVNPDLVMVSSQLMGPRGPWAGWLGYGPSTRPVGGMTWLWNFPGGGMPPGAQVVFPDHVAGRICALGAAAALIGRDRRRQEGAPGDQAAHLEVAQVEVVLNLLADYFLAEGLAPGSVEPLGNRRPEGSPWGVYPCAGEERWCVITCRDDRDWVALKRVLGEPPWATDPALDTAAGRAAAADRLDMELARWTAERPDSEVMNALQAVGVPAGRMVYASDVPSEPQLTARGYPRPIDQPGLGEIILEGSCFRGERMGGPVIEPAPALGQHTREVARELLGLSDDRIDALIGAGVLEVERPLTPAGG